MIKVIKALLHCQRSSLFSELHIMLLIRAKAMQPMPGSDRGVLWATHSWKTWWLPSVPISVICDGLHWARSLVQGSTAVVASAFSEGHCGRQSGSTPPESHWDGQGLSWQPVEVESHGLVLPRSGGPSEALGSTDPKAILPRSCRYNQTVCAVVELRVWIQYGDRRKATSCD